MTSLLDPAILDKTPGLLLHGPELNVTILTLSLSFHFGGS